MKDIILAAYFTSEFICEKNTVCHSLWHTFSRAVITLLCDFRWFGNIVDYILLANDHYKRTIYKEKRDSAAHFYMCPQYNSEIGPFVAVLYIGEKLRTSITNTKKVHIHTQARRH